MNPARSVPDSRGTAVPAVGADSVSHRRSVRQKTSPPRIRAASHRLRRGEPSVQGLRTSAISFERALSWAVPAQAPEAVCPTLQLPVFAGGREPKVSRPWSRQSQPALPRQTASGATLHCVPRPWSLGDSKPGFPHQGRSDINRRSPPDRPALETPSNQGPPRDSRLSLSADASVVPRPGDGKRVNTYTTGGSGWRRCWSYYPLSSL